MNIEQLRDYCLSKAAVTEGFPFGEDTLVFKVKEKLFLLVGLNSYPLQFNVKCDPDQAIEWREQYAGTVLPGYHMNKKHWNTVVIDGKITTSLLQEMIDHSYNLVALGKANKKK